MIGQLPLSTVISRGGDLKGLDELLIPTAQASFNQMLILAIVGAVAGVVVGFVWAKRTKHTEGTGRMVNEGMSSPPRVSADAETLNNEAVVNMMKAGLGDDLILEKMKHSRCAFALSSSELAQLKQNGISDRVITAMLQTQA